MHIILCRSCKIVIHRFSYFIDHIDTSSTDSVLCLISLLHRILYIEYRIIIVYRIEYHIIYRIASYIIYRISHSIVYCIAYRLPLLNGKLFMESDMEIYVLWIITELLESNMENDSIFYEETFYGN